MRAVIVLCYHAVSPTWSAALSVTPDALERQLTQLVRRGWHGVTFNQAVLEPSANRALAVTFDDAFASVKSLAEPILTGLGLPATVFAPTAFMSRRQPLRWAGIDHWQGTSDHDELTGMDWEDLGWLTEHGWEIASHTRTHPRLTALGDDDLDDELAGSLQDIGDRLGAPCRSIAYPYGDVDARVAARAREHGYLAGAAMSSNLRLPDMHCYPRIGIYRIDTDWRFRLKMTSGIRRIRASRLWRKRDPAPSTTRAKP